MTAVAIGALLGLAATGLIMGLGIVALCLWDPLDRQLTALDRQLHKAWRWLRVEVERMRAMEIEDREA